MNLRSGRGYPPGNPQTRAGKATGCHFAGLLNIFPGKRGVPKPDRPIGGFWANNERALFQKASGLLAKWERENDCYSGMAVLEMWLFSPRPSKALIGGEKPRRRLPKRPPRFTGVTVSV
jgi:hypothetical protein